MDGSSPSMTLPCAFTPEPTPNAISVEQLLLFFRIIGYDAPFAVKPKPIMPWIFRNLPAPDAIFPPHFGHHEAIDPDAPEGNVSASP